MSTTPPTELVVLDVNETLFSLAPVAERMAEVGLRGQLELWFTRILRDGFAATAAGGFASFSELAEHHLAALLRRHGLPAGETRTSHVLAGFEEVTPHADVAAGLTALRDARIPTVALTNGSAEITRGFLERSGLADLVDDVHDVLGTGRWKPAPEPYLEVVGRRGVTPAAAAMVAVHPWDLLGAGAAGLATAWLDREGDTAYPAAFGAPDLRATTLEELARLLRTRRDG
jgi:2-haloacid dehalogenase